MNLASLLSEIEASEGLFQKVLNILPAMSVPDVEKTPLKEFLEATKELSFDLKYNRASRAPLGETFVPLSISSLRLGISTYISAVSPEVDFI